MLFGALSAPAMGQDSLAALPKLPELFEFGADGVQIYVCKPKAEANKEPGFAWVFEAPEAVLFDADGKQAGTHAKGPSWTLSDGSSVTGELAVSQPSPKKDSIPWLAIKVISHQGKGKLDAAAIVRRVDTDGGAAPAEGCDATHQGETVRVPYSATYQFFGP